MIKDCTEKALCLFFIAFRTKRITVEGEEDNLFVLYSANNMSKCKDNAMTSLLLGCGFPVRIWESCLRSLSMSFVGSTLPALAMKDQSPNTKRAARTRIVVERRRIDQVGGSLRW
jgi:hypothetical protein